MNLGRMVAREIARADRRSSVYRRMQREAAARPESLRVQTPSGEVWMSPIEVALYEAMRREGLSPFPQFYIQGYYVDFAFPDVGVLHPSHCGWATVESKSCVVLYRSNAPACAARAVLAKRAPTSAGDIGRKLRPAWSACSRISIESQPVITTLVGRFIA